MAETQEITPGPWQLDEVSICRFEICTDTESVAEIECRTGNARLIACAPEMYEKLKEIDRRWNDWAREGPLTIHFEDMQQIREILAKARGESDA